VTYQTAHHWWQAGKLDAYPLPVQAITVALYARVSSIGQKRDLERQLDRLKEYAAAPALMSLACTSLP